jgi:uncharacterized protein YndB with AHSA1/START domain
MSRRELEMERVYQASLEEIWGLWTTPRGFESWWGPEGFVVEVNQLDLRPGGELRYTMTATGAPQIAAMRRAGMPLATEARIVFTEVTPPRRLAYLHLADFIPGVKPYDVATRVELVPEKNGVRMMLRFQAMHDEEWTKRAVMGWESQLQRLDARVR